jgi:hypothetical protein
MGILTAEAKVNLEIEDTMSQKGSIVQSFSEAVQSIRTMTEESVVRRKRLGESNYLKELELPFEDLQLWADKLRFCNPEITPAQPLSVVASYFHQLIEFSTEIGNYDGMPGDKRSTFVKRFIKIIEDARPYITDILAVNGIRPVAETQVMLSHQRAISEETLASIKAKLNEATEATAAIKQIAGKSAVSAEAKHFEELAGQHKLSARWWLFASIAIAGIILGFAFSQFLHPYSFETGKAVAYQKLATKVVSLSVLTFFLIFFVRNYNTSRHNFIVNIHRAKALETFRAFVSSATNDNIRDQILLQSSRSVFVHQTTGYLRKDAEMGTLPILDWIKLLSGK